jgi:adenosine deaminase
MPHQLTFFDERLPSPDIPPSLESRPKIDLHCHLLGSVTPTIYKELVEAYHLDDPSTAAASLDDLLIIHERVDGLQAFFKPWPLLSRLLVRPEVLTALTSSVLKSFAHDHVVYSELRATWGMTGREPFSVIEFLKAIQLGIREAEKRHGVTARVVLGITRHIFSRHVAVERRRLWRQLLAAAGSFRDSLVVGFDISGVEEGFPIRSYAQELNEAAAAGFKITIHSGETTGVTELWDAVRAVRPKRIGHALAAVADADLLAYLAEHSIAIEACPTTNWLTKTVRTIPEHPLRRFIDAGVPVVVCTDNPGLCRTSLTREFALLISEGVLSHTEVVSMIRESPQHSFATGLLADRLRAHIDR